MPKTDALEKRRIKLRDKWKTISNNPWVNSTQYSLNQVPQLKKVRKKAQTSMY
jgi:hypothetical protein